MLVCIMQYSLHEKRSTVLPRLDVLQSLRLMASCWLCAALSVGCVHVRTQAEDMIEKGDMEGDDGKDFVEELQASLSFHAVTLRAYASFLSHRLGAFILFLHGRMYDTRIRIALYFPHILVMYVQQWCFDVEKWSSLLFCRLLCRLLHRRLEYRCCPSVARVLRRIGFVCTSITREVYVLFFSFSER